jgi:hypothetical protein
MSALFKSWKLAFGVAEMDEGRVEMDGAYEEVPLTGVVVEFDMLRVS